MKEITNWKHEDCGRGHFFSTRKKVGTPFEKKSMDLRVRKLFEYLILSFLLRLFGIDLWRMWNDLGREQS